MQFIKKSKKTYYLNIHIHEIRNLLKYMEENSESIEIIQNGKKKRFLISIVESGGEGNYNRYDG